MSDWPQKLHTYFGKKLTQKEVTDWENEIRLFFDRNCPDGDEIMDVIRWRGEPWQDEIRHTASVNMKALRAWICMYRRDKNAGDHVPVIECAVCKDGWVIYTKNDGSTFAIPCGCTTGKRHLEKNYEEQDWEELKFFTEIAIQQTVKRDKELTEKGQAVLDSGLPFSEWYDKMFAEKHVAT